MAGPGFEVGVEFSFEFGGGAEGEFGKGVFVGSDVIVFEFDEVDDTEVDLADFVAVVIEEADDFLGEASAELELLANLAFDPGVIGCLTDMPKVVFAFVDGVDMATDADGTLGVEAAFAPGFSADIVEVSSIVMEDGVGDDLLVGGVGLCGFAIHEKIVFGVENLGKIVIDIGADALEITEVIEQAAWDDEDFFSVVFAHGRRLSGNAGGVDGI